MRLHVLTFCRFLVLGSKCSYFVLIFYETFSPITDENHSWRLQFTQTGDVVTIECFNTTLEEYKVIYPNGIFDYITKDDFGGIQVTLL